LLSAGESGVADEVAIGGVAIPKVKRDIQAQSSKRMGRLVKTLTKEQR